jgi:hypothetical protein
MITDRVIAAIIKVVADAAYEIALEGRASSSVCLQLEELSEDEGVLGQLVEKVREDVPDLGVAA